MKKLSTTLLMLFIGESLWAQELNLDSTALNSHQKNYYKACMFIRKGVIENDFVMFDRARDLLREKTTHLTPLELDTEDVSAEVPMTGHMYFTKEYALYLKSLSKKPFVDKGGLRGEDNKCMIMHHAIEPHGTLSYRAGIDEAGQMAMFVVAEVGGKIRLKIKRNDEIAEGLQYENDAVSYLSLFLNSQDHIIIEITNDTDKEISFVLASN